MRRLSHEGGERELSALNQLLNSHDRFVDFVARRVNSRTAAEDIVQSAYLKSLCHSEELIEESVVPWFYRVLRNAIIDHYRAEAAAGRAAEALQAEPMMQSEPLPDERNEVCACLGGLVESLKEEYRTALQVVDIEGRSLRDLAERAGISPENAAVRVHRARAALRKKVREACGACAEHACIDCRCRLPSK